MPFRRYPLLVAIGAVLMLVLFTATANVVRTRDSAAMNGEEPAIFPHDFAGNLPPIQIFPPL